MEAIQGRQAGGIKNFFSSLKSLKKGVGSEVGSGSRSAPYLSKKTTKDNFVPERHERMRRDPGEKDVPGPYPGPPAGSSASSSG